MDLNNIEFPASLVAELYPSSLIESNDIPAKKALMAEVGKDDVPPITIKGNNATWKSLGSNHKNILIIVKSSEAVHLADNELTFLTGILTACKLTLADVAILNLNKHPEASYKELTKYFKSKIVLLFEIEHHSLLRQGARFSQQIVLGISPSTRSRSPPPPTH